MTETQNLSLPMSGDEAPAQPASKVGGRGLYWTGRILLWFVVAVVGVSGILSLAGIGTTPSEPADPVTETDFPILEASAYAAQFATVYLDTEGEEERLEALADYLGESQARVLLPPAQAWEASDIYVAAVQESDEHNALVSLNLRLNGAPMRLDVPVYADDDGMAITGAPALLPAEAGTSRPAAPRLAHDAEAAQDITPVLDGFFTSYASSEEGDHLSRYVEPDHDLPALPAGMVDLVQVRDVLVPQGDADQPRTVQATVVWDVLPPEPSSEEGDEEEAEEAVPAQITQVYAVTMVREGSSWYVRDISGTPTATK